jgi:phage major head subunit gpT-like protein
MSATPAKIRQVDAEVRTRVEAGRKKTATNHQLVARKVTGGVGRGLYAAMDDIPHIQERNQSGYKTAEPGATVYEINSADVGLILKMKKNHVKDDMWGVYGPKSQTLGQRIAQFPDRGLFRLLKEGDQTTMNGKPIKWVDNLAFFSTAHLVNPNDESKGTFSNKKTSQALSAENLAESIQLFLELPDTEGEKIDLFPNRLIVPPALEYTAATLLQARTVSTGGDNMLSNEALAARRRNRIELVVSAELSGDDGIWYLAYQEGDIAPMVYQETDPLIIIPKIADTDDNVVYEKEYHWVVEGRAAFGWGDPRLILRNEA